MTPAYTLDSVTLNPDHVTFRSDSIGFTSSAITGGSDTAVLIIDDPFGEITVEVGQPFWADDTDADPERLWTGEVITFTVERTVYRSGPGRRYTLDMVGINAGAMFRVLSARDDPIRPAETNFERLDWLLATTAVSSSGGSTIFADDGFIGGSEFDVDAADYTGQYPADVLNSIAGEFDRNWFLFWNPDENHVTLFYSSVDQGISDSTLSISNVMSDHSSTCFYPDVDARLVRAGDEIYAGVLVQYRGSSLLVRNGVTELAYIDRHAVVRTDRIGKASTAATFGARYLAAHSLPRDTLTCELIIPDTQVNLLREGMRVDVRFTHLIGYETFTTVVVRRRTVAFNPDEANTYRVKLEMSATAVAGTTGGGDPGPFPSTGCDPQLVQEASDEAAPNSIVITLPAEPTVGNLLVCWVASRGIGSQWNPTGFTGMGAGYQVDPSTSPKAFVGRLFYRFVVAGDTATIAGTTVGSTGIHVHVSEWTSLDTFEGMTTTTDDTDDAGDPMIFGGGPVTPVAGKAALEICAIMPSLNVSDTFTPNGVAGAINLDSSGSPSNAMSKSWVGYKAGPNASGSPITFTCASTPSGGISRGWFALTAVFSGTCVDAVPGVGTPIRNEFIGDGDDVTVEWTTHFSYAPGTLVVFVDGVPIINGLTETDPLTGTFTLDFAPHGAIGDTRAERITANYVRGVP